MTDFTIYDDTGEEDGDWEEDIPAYSEPGRILFWLQPTPLDSYQYEIEVLDFDHSSVWHIEQGVGFRYWIDGHVDLELEGYYVIEGITGQYHRGDWSAGEDDDETWDFKSCRRATEEEIRTEMLYDIRGAK